MNKPKNCCANASCQYRCLGAGSIGYVCDYMDYCDYQLPKDSRRKGNTPLTSKDIKPTEWDR